MHTPDKDTIEFFDYTSSAAACVLVDDLRGAIECLELAIEGLNSSIEGRRFR